MDFEPEGTHESLIPSARAKTAWRTRNLLVGAKVSFVFWHGALALSVSVTLGYHARWSWWTAFTPAWVGNSMCIVLIIWSWFASFPYVKLCLLEHQARLGERNPSILTSILPDIVMAILGLFYVVIIFVAEGFFCQYLSRKQRGEPHSFIPSAAFFFVASLLACVRGVLVKSSSELFNAFGGAFLATTALALCIELGVLDLGSAALVLPSILSTVGLLVAACRRLRGSSLVLCREERALRVFEQLVLLGMLASLVALGLLLLLGPAGQYADASASAGAVASCCVCAAALLRLRMAAVEGRLGSINQRLVAWRVAEEFNTHSEEFSGDTPPDAGGPA